MLINLKNTNKMNEQFVNDNWFGNIVEANFQKSMRGKKLFVVVRWCVTNWAEQLPVEKIFYFR